MAGTSTSIRSAVGHWVVANWPLLVCAVGAISVAAAYLITTHLRAGTMGFPIDDSYIYLTYAKQIGRLEPMSYYPGGPYSAGSTSPLWPFVLAPLWTLGFRGALFVYAAFAVSAFLVAATTVLAFRLVEHIADRPSAAVAAVATAMCGAFTYGSLAAMEVGLAAALLLWLSLKLMKEHGGNRASRGLLVLFALTSVARPELTVLVGGFVALRALLCLRRGQVRLAGRWLLPLLLPLVWVVANKFYAGHLFPNTGVAKSHFYLPGFTWAGYFELLPRLLRDMFVGLFWSASSPLWQPQLVFLLSIAGIVHLLVWAQREAQPWVALLLASAPVALIFAVIAASGQWSFHNYRYISAAFAWLAVLVALGASLPLALLSTSLRSRWRWPIRLAPLGLCAVIAILSWADLRDNARYFAQGVRDTSDQVVKIGRFVDAQLPPDAHVAFHDAGAISYYGDRRGTDILGLVSNGYAPHANSGPGTRFENLERVAADHRPTHFAYYRGWLGTQELFGETLLRTPLRSSTFKGKPRLVGGGNMEVMVAKWGAVASGHRLCDDVPGWSIVDSVDVGDIRGEAAHNYAGDFGPRRFRDPTARWSVVNTSSCGSLASITDGGRTIRGRSGESFRVRIDSSRDAQLVVRSGGKDSRWSKSAAADVVLKVSVDGKTVGALAMKTRGGLADSAIAVPATMLEADTAVFSVVAESTTNYRIYHYFVLQPSTPP